MSVIANGFVVEGQIECDGCGKPIETGSKLNGVARGWRHEQCARESSVQLYDSSVRVGETRDRLMHMRSMVRSGTDPDTLRAVLLALLDEALR